MKNINSFIYKYALTFIIFGFVNLLVINTTAAQTYTITGSATSGSCAGPAFTLQGSCGSTIIACCISPGVTQPPIGTGYTVNGSTLVSSGYQNLNIVSGTPCPCVIQGVTLTANPSTISSGGSSILTATPSGSYTYNWSNGSSGSSNTLTVSPTTSTAYNVTVSSGGCSGAAGTQVNVNTGCTLSATLTANPSTISQGGSTTLTVTPSGGTAPYTYAWSNGSTSASQTVSPASTTVYHVTVTDANGCARSDVTTCTVNPTGCGAFSVSIGGINPTVPMGTSHSIFAVVSGGSGNTSYNWGNGLGTSASINVTLNSNTTYFVTATDPVLNCVATASYAIAVVNCNVTASANSSPSAIVPGGSAIITANASGGTPPYTYVWSNSLGLTQSVTVSPTATTSYSVTVRDVNGVYCQTVTAVTVTVNSCSFNVSTSSTPNATGAYYISASASGGSGNYSYSWGSTGTGATLSVSPTVTTTYHVTVTDNATLCEIKTSLTVNVGGAGSCPAFNVILNALPTTVAANNPVDLSAAAYNGSGSYAYTWGGNLGTGSTKTVYPTTNSTYYVTATDTGTGCTAVGYINVTVSGVSTPCYLTGSISASASVVPLGGSSVLTPSASGGSGNYQYMWWGWGSYTTPTPRTVVPTTTTNYQLRIYDLSNSGCYADANVTVAVCTLAITASSSPSAIMFGESTTLSASATGGSGVYTYTWSNGFVGPTQTVSPTAPTTNYAVTVTSSNGTCGNAALTTVTVLNSPCASFSASVTPNAMTFNGQVVLTAAATGGSGSYTYAWNNGVTTTTQTVQPTTTTTYTVTITDNINGCQANASVTVPPNNPSCVESAGNGYCCDQSTLSAGQISAQSTALVGELVPVNNVLLPTGGSTSAGTATGGGYYLYTFYVLGPGIGTWTVIGTAQSPNIISTTYTPTAVGTYYIRRCVQLKCGNTTTTGGVCTQVTITVNACDNVTNAGGIAGAETNCDAYNPGLITSTTAATGGTVAGGTISYQWQVSTNGTTWVDIPDATSDTYDPPSIISATTYYRRGAQRGSCPFIYTASVIKTVTNYSIGGVIAANESVCGSFNPALISSSTLPSGGSGGTPQYQWQISTDNINWSNIAGATAATYDPPAIITGTTYYRRAAKRSTCLAWVYSNTVKKSVVNNFTDGGVIGSSATACSSVAQIPITETTAPAGGNDGIIEYIWQSSTNSGATWATIAGATSATYTPAAITVTTQYRRGTRRNPCTAYFNSNVVTRTVITNITSAGTIAAPETNCAAYNPAEIISTAAASGGTGSVDSIYYQWQMSVDNATWITITGANSPNFDPGFINATTYYRRGARTNPCTAFLYTTSVAKTVTNYSNAGTISGDQSVCGAYTVAPTIISSTAVPSGGTGGVLEYQWEKSTDNINWTVITGATAATYTPVLPATVTTYYRRGAKRSICTGWIYSNIVTKAVVNNFTTGGVIGNDETTCSGAAQDEIVTLTIPAGGNDGTVEYYWQSSPNGTTWTTIAGATSASYLPTTLTATMYYRRYTRRSPCTAYQVSNVVVKTVSTNITTAGTITGAETSGCQPFDPAPITALTAPSGGTGSVDSIYYQWQKSTDNATWVDIAGANSASYDPPVINATTYYRRAARRNPCAPWLYTTSIAKTMILNYTNGGTIAANQTGCGVYTPATITSSTLPSGGSGGTAQYQWQVSGDNMSWMDISGATAATYSPTAIGMTTYYRRGARLDVCSPFVYSNIVIKTSINAIISGTNATCNGATTTLTASGGGTYAWSSSETTAVINKIAGTYTVTITNGGCTSATTRTVVNTNVTAAIAGTTTTCNGASTTLTASGGGTYAWNTGETTAAITKIAGIYTVTVTNTACTSTASVTVTNAAGSVGNYVWSDFNANGINDEAITAGINGITVELWNATTNTLVSSTITANDGSGNAGYYNFVICTSGDYFIKFPTGYGTKNLSTQTLTAATDGNSDANTTTGISPTFTINVNGNGTAKDNPTIDAGYACPGGCVQITIIKN